MVNRIRINFFIYYSSAFIFFLSVSVFGANLLPQIQADSLTWSSSRLGGYENWRRAQSTLSRFENFKTEVYLSDLADRFNQMVRTRQIKNNIASNPVAIKTFLTETKSHFYVSDTLNAAIWRMGGGFYIVHAGLFHLIASESVFSFFLLLEFAHEALGHSVPDFSRSNFAVDEIEFWGQHVHTDPILDRSFTYSLQEQSEALSLVYSFVQSQSGEFDKNLQSVLRVLEVLGRSPAQSSLFVLNRNLKLASKLPFEKITLSSVPSNLISVDLFKRIEQDLFRSDLQHYPWLSSVAEYADVEKESSLKSAIKKFNKIHLQRGLKKITLAEKYVLGRLYFKFKNFRLAYQNAQSVLKDQPKIEPFLWQKMNSLLYFGSFVRCQQIAKTSDAWINFDHRKKLLYIQCAFLAGHHSTALELAQEFTKSHPRDFEGVFWKAFININLRRLKYEHLKELEMRWGDRPMVRALKIFHYSALKQFNLVQDAIDFHAKQKYSNQEWGIYEFAHSWYRKKYFSDDLLTQSIQKSAERKWPMAEILSRYSSL